MNATEIAELLQPYLPAGWLDSSQLQALAAYLELLKRWNSRTNLTAVRDDRNIVLRHFGESLFAASQLLGGNAGGGQRSSHADTNTGEPGEQSVVDVGSGAGFPGLPIKIYAPQVRLTLIESQNKKATFLKEVIRTLRLQNASVYTGRAETYNGRADLVTLRAVEQFERVLTVAAGLVEVPKGDLDLRSDWTEIAYRLKADHVNRIGRLALLIGGSQQKTARQVLPRFRWEEPIAIPLSAERVLLVGSPSV